MSRSPRAMIGSVFFFVLSLLYSVGFVYAQSCPGARNISCGDWKYENTSSADDCNDSAQDIHPDATEICGDDVDQDCDGNDEQCPCLDADGDTYQDQACSGTDCEDGSSFIHPDAEEICSDGVDQDCDGKDLPCASCMDDDGDGYLSVDCGGDDCDENNPNINRRCYREL